MRKFRKIVGVILVVIALDFAVIIIVNWWSDPIRRLQNGVSDIHDWRSPDLNFTGDFARCIAAKCTEEQFHQYAKDQGFKQRSSTPELPGVAVWSASERMSWWTPPRDIAGVYILKQHRTVRLLGYKNGNLYYYICQT